MEQTERTRDIFEDLGHYPPAPLIGVPRIDQLYDKLEDMGIKRNPLSYLIIYSSMILTGFNRFIRHLPESLEDILRKSNTRIPGLFSPVISATLAIKDDCRQLSILERATTLLFAARNLYDDIYNGKFSPDYLNHQCLEMGEYPNLFSTCVYIKGNEVRLFKSRMITKIIVAVNGYLYELDIGNPGHDILQAQIIDLLSMVINNNTGIKETNHFSYNGTLTCAQANTQIKAFKLLENDPVSRQSLSSLRNSFLTVCLEPDKFPSSYNEAAEMAHSGNFSNRWYHSSLQIVVFGNAKACLIFNYTAYLDGNVMMRAASELQKRAQDVCMGSNGQTTSYSPTKPVKLFLRPDRKILKRISADIASIQDNQQATFEITGVGTDFFTRYHLNPIEVFVLAIQMFMKRITGQIIRIDQFLALSRYRFMDLTTTSVTTPESIKFVEYMENPTYSTETAIKLLKDAIDSQIKKCKESRKNMGFERLIQLFLVTRNIPARIFVMVIFILTVTLLKLFNLFQSKSLYQVLLSHPAIYPEVISVGRPGIRLPRKFVKYFALHYQIHRDSIHLCFMPGADLEVSNNEIVSGLEVSLKRIQSLFE